MAAMLSGPKARNVTAWAGASPTSAGPGNRSNGFLQGLKDRNITSASIPPDVPPFQGSGICWGMSTWGFTPGTRLTPRAEPTNPHDPFAVEILHGPANLGYVSRFCNRRVNRLLLDCVPLGYSSGGGFSPGSSLPFQPPITLAFTALAYRTTSREHLRFPSEQPQASIAGIQKRFRET
jgi:hypothetical protein